MPAREPWVLFEDDDLLAVHKPAGVTTHRTSPAAQEGLFEWATRLRGGAALALVHRLDKETSGLLLLGKSARASRALSAQWEARAVEKRYLLLCRQDPARAGELRCDAPLPRQGDPGPREALTQLRRLERGAGLELWEARPRTGRTHQVREHAARLGMPILGDAELGGPPAARLFLHAAGLSLRHPDGRPLELEAPLPGAFRRALGGAPPGSWALRAAAAREAREALLDPDDTDAFVWLDRHHDGCPGLRVEALGPVARVVRWEEEDDGAPPDDLPAPLVEALLERARAVVVQDRPRRGVGAPPRLVAGELPPSPFPARELGLRYLIDLAASATSTGLFLDQRETRRRLLARDLRGRAVLNAFAHTGALSVAAARAGASTVTLDLSKAYLERARENLAANGIDPAAGHDFIYGDALEWLRRLERKGRRFDLVLVDPPSSSTSRRGRRWSVAQDLHHLVALAAALVVPGGTLYVSTNLRKLRPEAFQDHLARGLTAAGRVGAVELATLPLDFRSGPGDPPYLKAGWISL